MTLNEIEAYCLTKPSAYLDWPFGPDFAVVKVKAPSMKKGRIFAQPFILRGEPKVTLNCDMAARTLCVLLAHAAWMTGELYRAVYPGTVTRGWPARQYSRLNSHLSNAVDIKSKPI
jgi:hypothetical protein